MSRQVDDKHVRGSVSRGAARLGGVQCWAGVLQSKHPAGSGHWIDVHWPSLLLCVLALVSALYERVRSPVARERQQADPRCAPGVYLPSKGSAVLRVRGSILEVRSAHTRRSHVPHTRARTHTPDTLILHTPLTRIAHAGLPATTRIDLPPPRKTNKQGTHSCAHLKCRNWASALSQIGMVRHGQHHHQSVVRDVHHDQHPTRGDRHRP